MARFPLETAARATFDGNGRGETRLSPAVYGTSWVVKRMAVSASSPCKFSVYRNTISPSFLADFTTRGDGDISETNIELQTLDTLIFVWENGAAGGNGTVVLYGEVVRG